ncbi:MAG: TetR family transcriptional regulator [Desulfobulbus sp.]|nr:TetR family transcriptional regulator [Desulfobulbus sp.]
MITETSSAKQKQTTRDRILDAAERVFADKGLDGSSVRDITTAANVNLAAVNYHFGSKIGLIEAVFSRHLGPMNTARIALLDSVEAQSGENSPPIESVLDAFIRPVVVHHFAEHGVNDAFMRLMSRCLNEPPLHLEQVTHHFDVLMNRFHTAFSRALPDHSPSEIFWGVHFTIGIMHHTLHVLSHLHHLPFSPPESADAQTVVERLVAYTAAGMKAQHAASPSVGFAAGQFPPRNPATNQ